MSDVLVITGGASGMGNSVAKEADDSYTLVLADLPGEKLDAAVQELKDAGRDAHGFGCDVTNAQNVYDLSQFAQSLGEVKALVHAAGVSPHLASAEKIFEINACGTVNINEAFAAVMKEGAAIVNVASMSAYMAPEDRIPYAMFETVEHGVQALKEAGLAMLAQVPEEQKGGLAGMSYMFSKVFVRWYTRTTALVLGKKGIRVVSVSPGTIDTPMGRAEGKDAADLGMMSALGRLGQPEELARVMLFLASDKASYLTGFDVLVDGGTIAALEAQRKNA
ncbi:MAG: SDR family oxidoreductase [Actinomycetaceae bacterium]|nr:SDR family oxidoreductase [Actinomycetaceae bacterium]